MKFLERLLKRPKKTEADPEVVLHKDPYLAYALREIHEQFTVPVNQSGVADWLADDQRSRKKIEDLSVKEVGLLRLQYRSQYKDEEGAANWGTEFQVLFNMYISCHKIIEYERGIKDGIHSELNEEEFYAGKPQVVKFSNGAYGIYYPPTDSTYPVAPGTIYDFVINREFNPPEDGENRSKNFPGEPGIKLLN